MINQGDRLGVIVWKTDDRDAVYAYLEAQPELAKKCKIIKARPPGDRSYTPEFEADKPICILTLQGCKGIEFRAVHWLFCETAIDYHTPEHYYTLVTRAKTSLNIMYEKNLPQALAGSHSQNRGPIW